MSSILKALKKVEAETAEQEDVLAAPEGLDTRAAIRRSARNGRFPFYVKFTVTAAACIILFAIGWYSLSDRENDAEQMVVTQTPSKQPEIERQVIPAPAARKRRPVQRNTVRPRRRPAQENVTPRRPPGRAPAAVQPVKPAAVRRPPEAPAPAPRAGASARTGQIPVLPSEQGKLTLQAISWAENSSGRMAVINNQIVREGGAVDGFTITEIHPDEVVIRRGTDDWKLVFGLRSP